MWTAFKIAYPKIKFPSSLSDPSPESLRLASPTSNHHASQADSPPASSPLPRTRLHHQRNREISQETGDPEGDETRQDEMKWGTGSRNGVGPTYTDAFPKQSKDDATLHPSILSQRRASSFEPRTPASRYTLSSYTCTPSPSRAAQPYRTPFQNLNRQIPISSEPYCRIVDYKRLLSRGIKTTITRSWALQRIVLGPSESTHRETIYIEHVPKLTAYSHEPNFKFPALAIVSKPRITSGSRLKSSLAKKRCRKDPRCLWCRYTDRHLHPYSVMTK